MHVLVTFTWDIPRAEWLAKQWQDIAPVSVGGPGVGMRGGEFVPGMYLKPGGCPNYCWFCLVREREGGIRELPIHDGWNVLC